MPRITEYTAAVSTQGRSGLSNGDVFAVDGTNGVRKITANKLAEALAEKTLHNAAAVGVGYGKSGMYRGADLGSGATFAEASTPAQRSAIQNGTFDGLFIGDYWTVDSRVYRIADFNYWKRSGDTDFNTNHVVLVPDYSFGTTKMNTTNTTVGAYVNSYLYTNSSSVLNQARSTISSVFGSYLASHKMFLPNAVVDGAESAGAWYNSTVELMNELMVFGLYINSSKHEDARISTADKCQLALFRLNPGMINIRYGYWLRDVASSTKFIAVSQAGYPLAVDATTTAHTRPVFAVKGTTN